MYIASKIRGGENDSCSSLSENDKSQLLQTDPRDALRHAHSVEHKGERWVW